jgi:GMP synthase (glutamine-hydrolysing)
VLLLAGEIFKVAVLVVDNLSPYTKDILLCLRKLKANYEYKKFYENIDHKISSYEKVILSGRSKPSREINTANSKLILKCNLLGVPILGICYGAEIMALALGGSIRRMIAPVREMNHIVLSESPEASIIFQKSKILYVYESHAYCVARIPEDFVSIATSKYCKNEIFANLGRRLIGVQFHPEKSKDDGLDLFSSFLHL